MWVCKGEEVRGFIAFENGMYIQYMRIYLVLIDDWLGGPKDEMLNNFNWFKQNPNMFEDQPQRVTFD